MINETLRLRDYFPKLDSDATLTTYVQDYNSELDISRRPSMIVCPGGGYVFCSGREEENIALAFSARGYNCFVLEYSVRNTAPDKHYPTQLCEVAAAVKLVKDKAEEYNGNKDWVFTVGFSAGGHLAAMGATLYNRPEVLSALDIGKDEARPDATILSYAVITAGIMAHRDSFDNLLGDKKTDDMYLELTSLEKQVAADTPPMFIWSTFEDVVVPCENSMLMANALREKGVPFELHIYERGRHGLSLANRLAYSNNNPEKKISVPYPAEGWVAEADLWLNQKFNLC